MRARSSRACRTSWTATRRRAAAPTATARRMRSPRHLRSRRPPRSPRPAREATMEGVKPAARIFNFGAGPATMPVEVLEKAKWELVNWHEAGMSVMEMSHRGKEFVAIAADAEADLRKLLAIPASYKVLFLQGGATMQFAGVPMNLLR